MEALGDGRYKSVGESSLKHDELDLFLRCVLKYLTGSCGFLLDWQSALSSLERLTSSGVVTPGQVLPLVRASTAGCSEGDTRSGDRPWSDELEAKIFFHGLFKVSSIRDS
jgi:hypothetical protein